MRESDLEQHFRRRVLENDGYTIKLAPTEAGIPDRLVMFPFNRFYLVELKTDTGSLDEIQKVWHQRIYDTAGVTVFTLYGKDQIDSWVATYAVGG